MDTPRTDREANRILEEFGPHNNGRFAAMCDFARRLERELNAPKTVSCVPMSIEHRKAISDALKYGTDAAYR